MIICFQEACMRTFNNDIYYQTFTERFKWLAGYIIWHGQKTLKMENQSLISMCLILAGFLCWGLGTTVPHTGKTDFFLFTERKTWSGHTLKKRVWLMGISYYNTKGIVTQINVCVFFFIGLFVALTNSIDTKRQWGHVLKSLSNFFLL